MARGDVPINMTVTPLIANAFLYTGEQASTPTGLSEYIGGVDRAHRATTAASRPDNVGLSGEIGEYNGRQLVGRLLRLEMGARRHGTSCSPRYTAAKAAQLLTGDRQVGSSCRAARCI